MAMKLPHDREHIYAVLDESLQLEFSFLKVDQLIEVIAGLPRLEQDYILNWVKRIASTNIQIAYQYMTHAIEGMGVLDKKVIEAWAMHAMDMYDKSGLHAAMEVMRNLDSFVQDSHERAVGAAFDDVSGVLLHFAHGLSGRALKLAEAKQPHTDTETIYLPALVAQLQNQTDNFQLYKSMVAMCWAQARFGTFRVL